MCRCGTIWGVLPVQGISRSSASSWDLRTEIVGLGFLRGRRGWCLDPFPHSQVGVRKISPHCCMRWASSLQDFPSEWRQGQNLPRRYLTSLDLFEISDKSAGKELKGDSSWLSRKLFFIPYIFPFTLSGVRLRALLLVITVLSSAVKQGSLTFPWAPFTSGKLSALPWDCPVPGRGWLVTLAPLLFRN